jgi:hypothetical protein
MSCLDTGVLRAESMVFWGEVVPSEHIALFYSDEGALIDTLTRFLAGGLNAGESTIVIATPEHLRALRERLVNSNADLVKAIIEDRYITLDADVGLAAFMDGQMPDEDLLADFALSLLRRASAKNRRVRAFDEMLALLWARGYTAATIRLEFLWQEFCLKHSFSLLCSYPKAGFAPDSEPSIAQICAAHSRVI